MAVKRPSESVIEPSQSKRARFSPAFSDGEEEDLVFDEGEGSEDAAEEEAERTADVEDDEPSFAQFMGESDVEDFDESDEDGEEDLTTLQSELAGLPMGALLKAQSQLRQPGKKRAPAPLSTVDVEPAPKGRVRAPKSGRTVPRYEAAGDPTLLPAFLTGPNAAQPGVKKEKREKKELQGRESKHAPAVMSSKRAVGRARQVVAPTKVERRDPRFDSLSGAVNRSKFDKAYAFLDEQRTSELADLRKQVKAKSNASLKPEEREKQRKALTRLESQLEQKKRDARDRAVLSAHRKSEKAKRADGKGSYHLKRSEEKELLEKARQDQLAKEGKLAKSLRKKELKAAQKEKKSRPDARRLGGL